MIQIGIQVHPTWWFRPGYSIVTIQVKSRSSKFLYTLNLAVGFSIIRMEYDIRCLIMDLFIFVKKKKKWMNELCLKNKCFMFNFD